MCVDAVCMQCLTPALMYIHPSLLYTVKFWGLFPPTISYTLSSEPSELFFCAAMNPGKEAAMPDGDVVILMLEATVQDGRFGLRSLAAICPGWK